MLHIVLIEPNFLISRGVLFCMMGKCAYLFIGGTIAGLLVGGVGVYLWQAVARSPVTTNGIPELSTANHLVRDTTLRFGDAIERQDLASFRATTSPEFQRAFAVDAFVDAFRGFIDQDVNLRAVADLSPVLRVRRLGVDGKTLRLAGYFPTSPSRITFDYHYSLRPSRWQLSGIEIAVEPQ
jgi:hypothetical protein